VTFCFDGDAAGRKAAWRALESVLPRMRDGRQAFFLFLPDGEDPDSLIRAEGADGFSERLGEATPLSTFLFDSLAADVNLGTLEGKGRLAERAKPMLAQIPDGAFADLMRQRLTELTGVGARASTPATHVPTRRARAGTATPAPKRTLVRHAIALLLQQPALALGLHPPFRFATLRQPGIDLLTDIVTLVHDRPGISTGALLEHFADRSASDALQKLASTTLPGDEATLAAELEDTFERLEVQAIRQRIDELQDRQRQQGLDADEKDELRQLLRARLPAHDAAS
jgi:DNA primase